MGNSQIYSMADKHGAEMTDTLAFRPLTQEEIDNLGQWENNNYSNASGTVYEVADYIYRQQRRMGGMCQIHEGKYYINWQIKEK